MNDERTPPVTGKEPPPGYYEEHDAAVEKELVDDRAPPSDMEAEAAVLSAAIWSVDCREQARELLRSDDFFSEAHRHIFEACCSLETVDVVTIASWLRERGRLSQVGGIAYITEVLNAAPAIQNVAVYAKTVKQKSRLRKAIVIGQKLQAYGYSHRSIDVVKELESLTDADSTQETSHDVPNRWLEEGPLKHELTGIAPLDQHTGGGPVYGSRWYIVGAPDACKTALQVQLADMFAQRGLAVGMLAVDEDPDDLETRFMQRLGFLRHECESRLPSTVKLMREHLTQLHRIPIQYYGAEDTIESAAKKLHRVANGSRAALFIDSTQTVNCDSVLADDNEPSEYVRVTRNVWAIRHVASKYRMIVIATSEMNRDGYKNGAAAGMASAKQSGAIEYSARVMLSAEPYGEMAPDVFRMRIQKNKHGPRGIEFAMRLDRQRMTLDVVEAPQSPYVEQNRASERAAREAEREATEEQKRQQRRAKGDQEADAKFRELEELMVAIVSKNPNVGSVELRSMMSAKAVGGCGKDKFGLVVARCKLAGRIVVQQISTRELRYRTPDVAVSGDGGNILNGAPKVLNDVVGAAEKKSPIPPTGSQPDRAGSVGLGSGQQDNGFSQTEDNSGISLTNKLADESSEIPAISATSEKRLDDD